MTLVAKYGKIEIWSVAEAWGLDYYVYGILSDPIVCPSLGMAREKAAG
jgi:serine protease inhibitor ecotin